MIAPKPHSKRITTSPAALAATCGGAEWKQGLAGTAQPLAYDWRQAWTRVAMRQYRPDSFHVGHLLNPSAPTAAR
ncbi:hypothetical protein A8924_6866 [Saccharopolyspora erythraea NRRL 2338]|uniref:Uncharacterized protein n=1 Tax=Saccharopolyspora erythraea TaxID=1836 RepID=A0ABP3N473_SACER|nr:hypothetical protein A8924_6866 [Saccharopolyspora erythraea NRRL 2338]